MFLMSVDPNTLMLVFYPDLILKKIAEEVDPKDKNVQAVARKMVEIMIEENGVGLAAPQVGLSWRLFVTRDPEDEDRGIAWLNPHLEVTCNETEVDEEGCLSLPLIKGGVRRPLGIKISGYDIDGKEASAQSDAFIARIWQHENDHLDGVLITEKMSAMDRLVNRRLIRDLERAK
jgi:peptide deformylase